MRKSLETDVGITAPRYMRVGHYDLSCFLCFEVSHASYTQDESITPRYFSEMSRTEFPQSDCKITQSIMSFKHFVQIQTSEVVVYSLDDHMPVYYRTFPGNIPDSGSVETLLTDLRHAGFPNVALLTDRGYELELSNRIELKFNKQCKLVEIDD